MFLAWLLCLTKIGVREQSMPYCIVTHAKKETATNHPISIEIPRSNTQHKFESF